MGSDEQVTEISDNHESSLQHPMFNRMTSTNSISNDNNQKSQLPKSQFNNQALLFRDSKSDLFQGSTNHGSSDLFQNQQPDLDNLIESYDRLTQQDQAMVQHLLRQRIQEQMQSELALLIQNQLNELNVESLDKLNDQSRQDLIGQVQDQLVKRIQYQMQL